MTPEPRIKRLQVLVTPREKCEIVKAAVADERTLSDYVRLAALEKARQAQGDRP